MVINGETFYYLSKYRKLAGGATILGMVSLALKTNWFGFLDRFLPQLTKGRDVHPTLFSVIDGIPLKGVFVVLCVCWMGLTLFQLRYGPKPESREFYLTLWASVRDGDFFLN